MNQVFEDSVRGRMQELKQLYTQLFVLLDQSVRDEASEDGSFQGSESLATPIQGLMTDIDGRWRDFQSFIGAQEKWKNLCSPAMFEDIKAFATQLQHGLEVMNQLVQKRIDELAKRRDDVKDKLKDLHVKQTTHDAYRPPSTPTSSLLSSEA